MNTIEKVETRRFNLEFIRAWENYKYSYDEAQLKAEKANLNFHDIVLERSQLFEDEIA